MIDLSPKLNTTSDSGKVIEPNDYSFQFLFSDDEIPSGFRLGEDVWKNNNLIKIKVTPRPIAAVYFDLPTVPYQYTGNVITLPTPSVDSGVLGGGDSVEDVLKIVPMQNNKEVEFKDVGKYDLFLDFANDEAGGHYILTDSAAAAWVYSENDAAWTATIIPAPSHDLIISGIGTGSIDADGKKALAQAGTEVQFTAAFTVVSGATGYKFHDMMGNDLRYMNDVTVAVDNHKVESADSTWKAETGSDDTITKPLPMSSWQTTQTKR